MEEIPKSEFIRYINEKTTRMDFTRGFPDEVLLSLFQKVNVYTACMLRLVNKQLYKISRDEDLQSIFRLPRIHIQDTHGALIQDGDLYMWGYNYSHRLMDHTFGCSTKMNVEGKKVRRVLTGYTCTVVLTEDKSLYIWGYHACVGKTVKYPHLLHPRKMNQVQMAIDQSIAAVSEDGNFFLWQNVIFDGSTDTEINLPNDSVTRVFFTPYIVGFLTKKGHIYLSNYGCRRNLHLKMFCKVDWTQQLTFQIQDVIWWKNEEYAIVLSQDHILYEVPIDYDYQIQDQIKCIHGGVKKALLSNGLNNQNLYLSTYDGRIIKYNIKTKKKQIVSFAKVCMDFSIYKRCDQYEIDSIDDQGRISQCIAES